MRFDIQLPDDLTKYNRSSVLLYVSACYLLWIIPALISYLILSNNFHWAWILPIITLEILSGFGYFAIAGIAHEGLHGNLSENKYKSFFRGAILSAPVIGFYAPGFYALHWQHHRWVNQSKDPVAKHYSKFRNPFERIFLARIMEGPVYFLKTLNFLRTKHQPKSWMDTYDFKTISYLLIAIKLAIVSSFGALLLLGFATPIIKIIVLMFAIPFAISVLLASISPYLEHNNTNDNICARSQTSPVLTALRFGANFHLEHHYFQTIPCWRLPLVHKLMVSKYPECLDYSDSGLRETYKNLSSERGYGVCCDAPENK